MDGFARTYLRRRGLDKLYTLNMSGRLQRRYRHNSIASIWASAKLDKKQIGVLNVLALFQPDSIPHSIFVEMARSDGLKGTLPGITSEHDWQTIVGQIYQASQLKRNGDTVIEMHKIVRECAISRMRCADQEFESAFHAAVLILKSSWPSALSKGIGKGHETSRWARCIVLFPHISNLLQIFQDHHDMLPDKERALDFATLLSETAW